MKNEFSKFLTESRNNAALSQLEVSMELGYSTSQFVSNWERGISYPPVNILKTLAKMYRISDELMYEKMEAQMIEIVRQDLEERFKKASV